MLPIGVVIPTKNCATFVPEHVATMREWLDLVEEVVVVDSFSTDGTAELLRRSLQHPRLSLLQHPPGLYQSWNYGISQIKAKYTYIATVGDAVTREGLQRLLDAAESLSCDVVLSKPTFRDPAGGSVAPFDWPIDDMIRLLRITDPRRLGRLEALVFAITCVTAAMTGSCASDLFRTQALQRCPFPTDFGSAGDGAWGIRYALDVVWGVEPRTFSSFLVHPSNAPPAGKPAAPRFERVVGETIAQGRKTGAFSAGDASLLRIDEMVDAVTGYLDRKAEFDRQRRSSWPWVLNPQAWRVRSVRNRQRKRMEELRQAALQQIAAAGKAD
jgi:glycosyltransferase involved in cell wall biosynthesis